MHILFLSDNFPPEGNAPATRLYEHAIHWVKAGHKVTVITCAPNFPEGKLFEGYKNSWYQRDTLNGIDVVRVKTYIAPNNGFTRRILDYMSFMVMSVCAGVFQKKPDLVVATSPQFFSAVAGWALSGLKRVPFVFELRDLWPESAFAVGAVNKNFLYRRVEGIELFLYRKAAKIISVTHSFKDSLIERGIVADKIAVVTNGVDLTKYQPTEEKDPQLALEHGLNGKFVLGYLGTHGLAHALDCVLDCAVLLKDRKNICFLLVGAGAEREKLVARVEQECMSNVVMLPRQPKENLSRFWSLCDVSLIPLKDSFAFKKVIPSKLFESMGVGVPVLMSLPEGESTKIVRQLNVGITVPPENPQEMAKAITKFYEDEPFRQAVRNNCLTHAPDFSRKTLSLSMLKELESVVG